jgi:hypothetical protein
MNLFYLFGMKQLRSVRKKKLACAVSENVWVRVFIETTVGTDFRKRQIFVRRAIVKNGLYVILYRIHALYNISERTKSKKFVSQFRACFDLTQRNKNKEKREMS